MPCVWSNQTVSAWLAWLPKVGSLFTSRGIVVPQLGGGRVVLACLPPEKARSDPIERAPARGQGFWGGGESQVGTGDDYSAGTVTRNSLDTSKTR